MSSIVLQLKRFTEQLTSASIVVVDSNIPQEAVKFVCDTCWLAGVPGGCVFFARVLGGCGLLREYHAGMALVGFY